MRRMDGDVGAADGGGDAVCATTKRLANVVGTSGAPLGHRFRRLPSRKSPKDPRPPPIGRGDLGNAVARELAAEEEERRTQRFVCKTQQERQKQWKMVEDEIRKRVELGMEAFEEDLEERRDKLRELLVREEAQLTRELVERARKLEEQRAAELEAQKIEAAKEAEKSRLALLREKRLQRYVESNEEMREARQRAFTVDAKRANREQIAEAERRRRLQQEDESFWQKLSENRSRIEAAELASSASKRLQLEKQTAQQLREQMEERQRLQKQESNSTSTNELQGAPTFGENEMTEETRREKARRFKEDLDKQLEETRRCLRQRCDEERAIREMAAVFAKPEPTADVVRRDKETRRREMLAFMDSMREFREAVSRRETEAEEWARRWAAEAELKRREASRRAKEDRAKLCRETKLVWDRQLEEKRRQRLLELEADRADVDAEHEQSTKEEKARRRRAALEYGRELLAQHDWIEARRAREQRELDEAIERQRVEREREEAEMARELESRESKAVCGAS